MNLNEIADFILNVKKAKASGFRRFYVPKPNAKGDKVVDVSVDRHEFYVLTKIKGNTWSECFTTDIDRTEIIDRIVRVLGQDWFNMELTASGEKQIDDDDEVYYFWEWVMKNDVCCMAYRKDDGGIELLVDAEELGGFCESFVPDTSCVLDVKLSSGVVIIDVADLVGGRDPDEIWKYRPAGLRTVW